MNSIFRTIIGWLLVLLGIIFLIALPVALLTLIGIVICISVGVAIALSKPASTINCQLRKLPPPLSQEKIDAAVQINRTRLFNLTLGVYCAGPLLGVVYVLWIYLFVPNNTNAIAGFFAIWVLVALPLLNCWWSGLKNQKGFTPVTDSVRAEIESWCVTLNDNDDNDRLYIVDRFGKEVTFAEWNKIANDVRNFCREVDSLGRKLVMAEYELLKNYVRVIE